MITAKNVFYHALFNYGSVSGPQKFVWGFTNFDFEKDLKEQIINDGDYFDVNQVYNFQITAFNNIKVEESEEGEK